MSRMELDAPDTSSIWPKLVADDVANGPCVEVDLLHGLGDPARARRLMFARRSHLRGDVVHGLRFLRQQRGGLGLLVDGAAVLADVIAHLRGRAVEAARGLGLLLKRRGDALGHLERRRRRVDDAPEGGAGVAGKIDRATDAVDAVLHRCHAACEACLTPLTIALISFVDLRVCSASSRISSATTLKPRPCSPACAAMMAAFSASRFVRCVTCADHFENLPDLPDARGEIGQYVGGALGQLARVFDSGHGLVDRRPPRDGLLARAA